MADDPPKWRCPECEKGMDWRFMHLTEVAWFIYALSALLCEKCIAVKAEVYTIKLSFFSRWAQWLYIITYGHPGKDYPKENNPNDDLHANGCPA
jgi:hypothetical protein